MDIYLIGSHSKLKGFQHFDFWKSKMFEEFLLKLYFTSYRSVSDLGPDWPDSLTKWGGQAHRPVPQIRERGIGKK